MNTVNSFFKSNSLRSFFGSKQVNAQRINCLSELLVKHSIRLSVFAWKQVVCLSKLIKSVALLIVGFFASLVITEIPMEQGERMARIGAGQNKGRGFFRVDFWWKGYRITRKVDKSPVA
jgi:hypothetical protein